MNILIINFGMDQMSPYTFACMESQNMASISGCLGSDKDDIVQQLEVNMNGNRQIEFKTSVEHDFHVLLSVLFL